MSEWGDEVEVTEDKARLDAPSVYRLLKHNECLRNNLTTVICIKGSITVKAGDEAREAWCELSQDEQTALYIAPSKGGIFTTEERRIIKANFKLED